MAEKCAICGFELTEDDERYKSPHDYWPHCKEHTNHASYPQLWLLLKELNLKYEEPKQEERICAVCELPLTKEDMNMVEKTDVNFVCKFHRRFVGDFNIQLTHEKTGHFKPIIYQLLKTWNLNG